MPFRVVTELTGAFVVTQALFYFFFCSLFFFMDNILNTSKKRERAVILGYCATPLGVSEPFLSY